jgi:DNA-binding GntR family transcriptional regulator
MLQDDSKTVVSKTLADVAYQRLRRDIVSGVLAPGAKLPMEQLSKQYEIGMSPLREALARLVGDSLVVTEGQRGFWVAPLSIEELDDITRVRTLIETEALQLAIEKGGPEWEAAVRSAYDELTVQEARLQTAPDAAGLWEQANSRFHEALVSACGSPWLIRFRYQLYQQSERYRRISLANTSSSRCLHDEHTAIMEAAVRRQALKASRLIEVHLQHTADAVRLAFEATSGRPAAGG